jgi:hypothetical protein
MNIELLENLQHGFAIIHKEKSSEKTLVRMMTDKNGNVYKYDEYIESKFRHKLIKEYEKQLKTNKKLIMKVEDTLVNLTIPQLEALLPSYYGLVIERRIAELKEKENAVAKTHRGRKKAVKNSD